MPNLPCHMLWIGPRLGAVERACMRSVTRQGHDLVLWRYGPVDAIPEGITLRDAEEILPRSAIVRHHTGSVSLFSNRFRYELQHRGLGTWLDCDAYLLKPLDLKSPYLMGECEPGLINGGILRLPSHSPMICQLLDMFEKPRIPSWVPLRARLRLWARGVFTDAVDISTLPWGTFGPLAITYFVERHQLGAHALSPDVLYPVRWQDADWILDPNRQIEDVTSARTVSIHLWNERIKAFKDKPAREGSFLSRLQQEGA